MSNLTRKKVKVRGKNGKVYQRNMMVASQPSLTRKHWKTALAGGFAAGLAGGAGAYAGIHAGHSLGEKYAMRKYAKEKDPRAFRRRVEAGQHRGAIGGSLLGSVVGVAAVRRTQRHKQMMKDMQREARRDLESRHLVNLTGLQMIGSQAGTAAGMFGAHGAVLAYRKVRNWASNGRRR